MAVGSKGSMVFVFVIPNVFDSARPEVIVIHWGGWAVRNRFVCCCWRHFSNGGYDDGVAIRARNPIREQVFKQYPGEARDICFDHNFLFLLFLACIIIPVRT